MGKSLMEEIAALPPEKRSEVMSGLDPTAMLHNWELWSRPEQQVPSHDNWSTFAYIAGRGAGKTRSGCEWARSMAKRFPGSRGLLVARTAADVRDVLIQGDSGLINISPPSERPEWQPSKRQLVWPNGSMALLFSADVPDQLRGPQGHWALADEFATWTQVPDASGLTAWENLQIATRLGDDPKIFVMTTPKRVPLLKELMEKAETDPRIIMRRGSTMDNAGNLAKNYLEMIYGRFKGTRLARQELEGLMLDDTEGALWTSELLDVTRTTVVPLNQLSIVVGVDPSVAERPRDECGIVVIGATRESKLHQRHAYVLEDATVHGSPDKWAAQVARIARKWRAPVIAEVNQGGSLVRGAIATHAPEVRIFEVHSRQNKQLRAEPVVMAYEQNRVHHVGYLGELESQLCTWVPGESKGISPDRLDALVHACTALLIKQPKGLNFGRLRAKSASQHRIPSHRPAGAQTPDSPRRGRLSA